MNFLTGKNSLSAQQGAAPPIVRGLRGYAVASLCVALAFVCRRSLDPLWGDRVPFVLFFLAVFVVAQFAGTGPGILATVAGLALGDWFFVAPRHSFNLGSPANLVNVAFFFFICSVVLLLSWRARHALGREQAASALLRAQTQALRESEARYASIVENSHDAILLTDERGKILAANHEACRMFARTETELLGMERNALIDPAETERVAAALEERHSNGRVQLELSLRRRDGSVFLGEVSSAIFLDQDGSSRNSSIIRDITERKRSERELARLAAIVESSDDAIIGKSLDGTILTWNAGSERLYGYPASEAIGCHIDILLPPEKNAELAPLLERVARGEKIQHFETTRRTRDGRRIEVSLSISPVRDSSGRLIAASTIARDISDRRQAELERERLLAELQAALAEVKTLGGLLPICSHCKKIRDDQGYWNQIELYIRARSNATFTHSICPECATEHYGELLKSNTHRFVKAPPKNPVNAPAVRLPKSPA